MLALVFAAALIQEPTYAAERLRWVEADGKFYRVPASLTSSSLGELKLGMSGYYDQLKVVKVRAGNQDMYVAGLYTTTTLTPSGGLKLKQSFSTEQAATIRLFGFSTEGLTDGATIPDGRKYAMTVVGTWDAPLKSGETRKMFIAVPLDWCKRGLTEEQFQRLLKSGVKLD